MGQMVPWRLVRIKKSRVWYYKPAIRWWGWRDLKPFCLSHDEYSRNTLMIGWPITGRIIIALRYCGDADCYEQSIRWAEEEDGDVC